MKWRDSLSRSFDKRQKYREDHGEYPSTTKIGANELYRKVKIHLGLFSKAVEADHHIDIMSESINIAHFSKQYFEAKQQQYLDKTSKQVR